MYRRKTFTTVKSVVLNGFYRVWNIKRIKFFAVIKGPVPYASEFAVFFKFDGSKIFTTCEGVVANRSYAFRNGEGYKAFTRRKDTFCKITNIVGKFDIR